MLFLSSLLNSNEGNCVSTVQRLVKILGLKVTSTTIVKQLKEHPDYPSMLSINDALTSWKVEALPLQCSVDTLKDIPPPFIAQIQQDRSVFFTIVKEHNSRQVIMSDPFSSKWKIKETEKFKNIWTGVVMLAEPQRNAGEDQFHKNRLLQQVRKLSISFAVGIILSLYAVTAIGILFQSGITGILLVVSLTLSLTGTGVCLLLLWYEIDAGNPALQKVCQAGKKTNCHAVLQSPASKIFNVFSWSEVGFVYFSGSLLAFILSGLNSGVMLLIIWLSLVALSYPLFSIYYQWRIVKQWCILCLMVQGIVIVQFLVNIVAENGSLFNLSLIHPDIIGKSVLAFLIPAVLWFTIKPFLLLSKENRRQIKELNRFKYNGGIFDGLLERERTIRYDATGLGITLGNPAAKTKIIKVCNPYCGPCASAHPVMEEILLANPEIQLQIIFTAAGDDTDDRSFPVRHLMALAEGNNPGLLQKALNDWYTAPVKDYQAFALKYPLQEDLGRQQHKLHAMKAWCDNSDIRHTPTFYVNGHQLPEMYTVTDLKYLLS